MRRPLSDRRPIGPVRQLTSNSCDITFISTYRVGNSQELKDVDEEVMDNIAARVTTRLENQFDHDPVTAVNSQWLDANRVKIFISTTLREATDTIEDIFIEEIQEEINRVTGSMPENTSYSFRV